MNNFAATTDTHVTCKNCKACCCRLQVLLLTDTGVPRNFIATDEWGGMTMAQLDDGWCAALNRDTMMCRIYQKRPLVCRDFAMGSYECMEERTAHLCTLATTGSHNAG
jgi:Fe-S-cluster containining protein